jgi:hypothetical protein
MHPEFSQRAIRDRQRDLEHKVRAARLERTTSRLPEPPKAVLLRLCRVTDDDALERLAILDGQPAPAGRYVVAEVDGAVVAAASLSSGRVLADPFERTAHLLPLLDLRVAELAPEARHGRSLPRWGAVRAWSRA